MDNFVTLVVAILVGGFCGAVLVGAVTLYFVRTGKPKTPMALPPEAETHLERPVGLDAAIRNANITPPPPPPSPDQFMTVDNLPPPVMGAGVPWLEGVGGIIAGQRIHIQKEETIIGRSRVCDVQFQDPKVSRQHAMLRLYKGRYFLQDMQSSRGTLVNSQPIQTHPLQEGDQIRMGDTVLIFHAPQSPATT